VVTEAWILDWFGCPTDNAAPALAEEGTADAALKPSI
jgi:hypothetical protein